MNASDGNRDFDIVGGVLDLKKWNWQLFAFYEFDANVSFVTDTNNLNRFDIGTYYHRKYQNFDFELNAVYQTGTMAVDPDDFGFAEVDVAAFMAAFEAGYTFEADIKPRVAAGIDYASGDDKPSDTDWKAYDNLYYTGHKFRGYFDEFIGSNPAGLMDMIFRLKLEPFEKSILGLDFHYFKTAEEYTVSEGTTTVTMVR